MMCLRLARFQDVQTYRAFRRQFSMLGDCSSGSYAGSFTVDVRPPGPPMPVSSLPPRGTCVLDKRLNWSAASVSSSGAGTGGASSQITRSLGSACITPISPRQIAQRQLRLQLSTEFADRPDIENKEALTAIQSD
eukprot:CAMPEP_0180188948 /NCGR_PEP_ID=MMETSP0987-20121128/56_1 /TAXON_ID=697907 /ORGANISM="non described non described, Strain CCMP2293" /LENGTH=134 /DNA_ID=CAMNT_0022143217 /DNA_START=143 /DNA_END=545 /DNA_ORIENTATION=-